MTHLSWLTLSGNEIRDITPLTQMTWLIDVNLGRNQIHDITPLTDLAYLSRLELRGNPIADTSPLRALLEKNPGMEIYIDVSETDTPPTTE